MEIPINYPLSDETRPEYQEALEKVQASKDRGGKVVDVKITEVAPGQFAGEIIMDEPI